MKFLKFNVFDEVLSICIAFKDLSADILWIFGCVLEDWTNDFKMFIGFLIIKIEQILGV